MNDISTKDTGPKTFPRSATCTYGKSSENSQWNQCKFAPYSTMKPALQFHGDNKTQKLYGETKLEMTNDGRLALAAQRLLLPTVANRDRLFFHFFFFLTNCISKGTCVCCPCRSSIFYFFNIYSVNFSNAGYVGQERQLSPFKFRPMQISRWLKPNLHPMMDLSFSISDLYF